MKRTALALALGLLVPASAAQAAPVTLTYDVVFNGFCDFGGGCTTTSPMNYELTLTYDDGITGTSTMGPTLYTHFGTPTLTLTGTGLTWVDDLPGTTPPASEDYAYAWSFDDGSMAFEHTLATNAVRTWGTAAHPFGYQYLKGVSITAHGYVVPDGTPTAATAADFYSWMTGGLGLDSILVSAYAVGVYYDNCNEDNLCTSLAFLPGSIRADGIATLRTPAAAVPEPTSMVLLGTGLVAFATRLRRRQ